MINVMVVEDDPMARKLFEIILAGSGRYDLTASIESASLAEFYCMTSDIDLILMDVCTALHASGLDAASKIKKKYPEIRIIIVTSQPECDFIDRARSSGVDSFWYKDPSEDILLRSWIERWQENRSIRIRHRSWIWDLRRASSSLPGNWKFSGN